jgi:hypothetical protein
MPVRLWPGSAGSRWTCMCQRPAVRRHTGSAQRGLLHQERPVPRFPLDPTGATWSTPMQRLSTEELP